MAIFGRKKKKDKGQKEFSPPVEVEKISKPATPESTDSEKSRKPRLEEPDRMMKKIEEKAVSEREFAPIFIKISKYKEIMNTMNHLKMNLDLIKSQLSILEDLNRLRDENLKILTTAFDKIDNRLTELDSEFRRPSAFVEEMHVKDVESLEETISGLSKQIERLKKEMKQAA